MTGDDEGYFVVWKYYSNGVHDVTFNREVDDLYRANDVAYGTASSGVTHSNSTSYDLGLRITRESSGTLELKSWIGTATNTVTGKTASTYDFNQVVYYGAAGQTFRVDDITVVPEPSSIALLLLGAGAFAFRRSVMRRD